MTLKNKFRLYILKLLPKNLLSRMVGFIAEIPWPSLILQPAITIFRKIYRIDMTESALQTFSSFNEFFTRPLRAECRPIDLTEDVVVSPVDGVLGSYGTIAKGILLQAKGLDYTLQDLVVKPEYIEVFRDGYYITLYLSPRHYHRIHTPISGEIESLSYIPGTLYPVNSFAVHHIAKLFARNERLLTLLNNSDIGKIAIIKIGATIVGKIRVVYDDVVSNQVCHPLYKKYENVVIKKGEELGRFQMGSTVILLFQKDKIEFPQGNSEREYRYGEFLANIRR